MVKEKFPQSLDNHCQCNNTLFTVVSGSFRKHFQQIMRLKEELKHNHVAVLSPAGEAVNTDDEFVILDSDPVTNPKLLQDSVFAKMRRSTFLVVANFDGYLGRAAVMEIGYAIALGITIYTVEDVEDPNLKPYCRPLSEAFPNIDVQLLNKPKEMNITSIASVKNFTKASEMTKAARSKR